MDRALGKLEARMFAYTQMRDQSTVRTGELVEHLGLTGTQERDLFRRLARARLIARVRPGLYLVPRRLPPRWIMESWRSPRPEYADRGSRRTLPDLRAQRLQPLRLRGTGSHPRLRLQQPHLR